MAPTTAVKVLDRPDPTALGEMTGAELAKQIETAKRYPRDTDKALRELEQLATRTDAVAEACMYTLKRTDKGQIVFITGPSIQFAELLNYCWGNTRAGARIVEEAEFHVKAQGLAYDLERNTGLVTEIRRGIRTSSGGRYSADMINVTCNAACSIAERNAIFDAIPRVLWWSVYEVVKEKAVGAAQIPEKLQNAMRFFVGKGAKPEDIFNAMGVKSIEDMTRTHLEIFIGLRTAMKEGPIDVAKIFTPEGAEERAKLSLVAEEESFNSIDKQLQGGKRDGASQKADAASTPGVAQRSADRGKGKGAKAKGDSPAADKAAAPPKEKDGGDGQPGESGQPGTPATEAGAQPSTVETDADLVARVEQEHKEAKGTHKDRPIKKAKANLERIAKGDDKALAARADKLLNLYDLDEPQD